MNSKIDIELIASINQKINSHMDLILLLPSIIDTVKNIVMAEAASLLLFDPHTEELIFDIVIGEKGNILTGTRIPRGAGIAGAVTVSREAVIVNDVAGDSRFYGEIDKYIHFKTRNLMALPMIVIDKFIGVLEIVNSVDRIAFDDDDLVKAKYIAGQAAIAISNRQLYDDLNNRVHELTNLYQLAHIISSSSWNENLFQTLIESITRQMKVEKASIVFYDDINKELYVEANFGFQHSGNGGRQTINMDNSIAGHILKTSDPLIVSDIRRDLSERFQNDDFFYKTHSFISVPAVFNNKAVGVLSLADKKNGAVFDSYDLRVLSTISSHIAETRYNIINRNLLEKQRRLQQEFSIASEMQKRQLPRIPETVLNHSISAFNKPAKEIGGDFYDFFNFENQRYGVLVGDISGKGIPAALSMGLTRNIVNAEIRVNRSPSLLLNNANRQIHKSSEFATFVTLFYVNVDTSKNLLTFGSAGHNPQLLIRPSEKRSFRLNAAGKPLGIKQITDYEEKVIRYLPGDILLLFTDGVVEFLGGSEMDINMGEQRLASIAYGFSDEGPGSIVRHLESLLESENIDEDLMDDFTIMAIKM